MSGRWWRAYSRARHDPKLLRLTDKDFRWWFNLVCSASDNGGVLPSHADLAVEFRVSGATMTRALDSLVLAGLLDHDETGIRPHNWNALQYQSDVSTDRVKRFRKRRSNVSETPSESETDTETDSVANATGGEPPQDPVKALFDDGVKLLTENACKPENARSIVGKWRKQHGDEATQAAIKAARFEGVTEPIAWITQRLANAGKPRENWNDRRIREGMAVILGGSK